jgi:hypothetical protein
MVATILDQVPLRRMPSSITLASGLGLCDPWQLLKPMRERDDWYGPYDGAVTFEDNVLGMPEIFLSLAVGSRIRNTEAFALFAKRAHF